MSKTDVPVSVRLRPGQLERIKASGRNVSDFLREAIDGALVPPPRLAVQGQTPMSGIYQFGDPEHPRYKATNGTGPGWGGSYFCCPFGTEGHFTPEAAGEHLMLRMVAAWRGQEDAASE